MIGEIPGHFAIAEREERTVRDAFVEVNTRQTLPPVDCSCYTGWKGQLESDRIRSWKEFRGAYADLPWKKPQGILQR